MSDRSLAYLDQPLKHRFLVLYEAVALSGEMPNYFIRSLLSEGRIRYDTVASTSEGQKPHHLEIEGPTGLITTTTATNLHPENETRLISLVVEDTPEQTRAVFHALAEEDLETPDLTEWHELQEWLALSETRATIPFAKRLAELVPPVAVRLRRDFGAVLGLIRAHAVLHQVNRKRDSDGRIVATLADYAAVRNLVTCNN